MDERLANIEEQKQKALQENNSAYDSMLQNSQDLYNRQNQYAEEYERRQNDILDKQLAYNEQINQQNRDKARQNFEAEQKRAKNDYQSYVNPYGNQAESFASSGLLNSGVSETAKLGAYNTYQNRNATANKVMQDAFLQYDNELAQARLNHDAGMAENALAKLQAQLNALETFTNSKNSITQNRLSNNQNLDSEYFNRYNTEYNNIQQEKAREEAIREWEAQMEYQKQRDAVADAQWQKEYNLSKSKTSTSGSGSNYVQLTDSAGELTDNINSNNLYKSGWKVSDIFGKGEITDSNGANVDDLDILTSGGGKYYLYDAPTNSYVKVTLASRVN